MRVAIFGVGRMGRRHIEAARRAGLEVAGIYDINRGSLDLARDEYGLPEAVLFDDTGALYRQARPDCVVVATTADSHCELVCMAAEHGVKFILVEKPMAVSLEQCDRMIATCRTHGAKLAVNHQMRFMEQYREVRRMLDSDAYGGFCSMNVVAGNIGVSMNASHYFEAFRYVAGEPLASVTAWFSPEAVPNPRGAQFADRAGSIRVVTAGGKRLFMEMGADQGHGVCVTYAGRYGIISVNELTGEMSAAVRNEEFRALPTTRYGMPATSSVRTIQAAEVIDTSAAVLKALLADRDSVTGEDGRRVVEVLVAAYQSAENGNARVDLGGALDRHRIFPWA